MHQFRTFMTHPWIKYALAGIWMINRLFCRILALVPRHERIVAVALGEKYAAEPTVAISVRQRFRTCWILDFLACPAGHLRKTNDRQP